MGGLESGGTRARHARRERTITTPHRYGSFRPEKIFA
jgi:hypothetical protein